VHAVSAHWPGSRAAIRGGNWNNGGNARSGFYLNLNNAPSNRNANIGFRAALSICQKMQGKADPAYSYLDKGACVLVLKKAKISYQAPAQ